MTGSAARQLPPPMTVTEFLAWPGDGTGRIFELVNGELRARDAANDAHGTMQTRLAALFTLHFDANRPGCRAVSNPGIEPRLQANWNYRIPELGVTCTPNRAGVHATPDPILLVEVLSPSNASDTWGNIAPYSTVPTVIEILVVDSRRVEAFVLRRNADGSWPRNPDRSVAGDVIELASIGLQIPIAAVYRGTHLAPD